MPEIAMHKHETPVYSDPRPTSACTTMPYVRRGPDGQIESLYRHGGEGSEYLPDGHPELMSFVGHDAPVANPSDFGRLDADFVRVIEDVIDTLIVKNILNITDLPGEAQAKLFARKSFRERVSRHSLRLFGERDYTESSFGQLVNDTNLGDLS
jgi:hypothetical protein